LNEMSYVMGIDSWKSSLPGYNNLPQPKNLREDHCICFAYYCLVKCIESLMQRPAFCEYMSYAPAKEFNNAEKHIYSEGVLAMGRNRTVATGFHTPPAPQKSTFLATIQYLSSYCITT
jgi:hypothetical protein